ncbi:hypothetical protein [Bacillus cereus group sp. BcHK140]|uniref:hypothetical protein n=1 Tax=Bacillus cereus group sp. BcHK140 TaxID=3018092 RepID=UPI003FA43654
MKEEKIQGNIKWITYNNLRFRIEKVNDDSSVIWVSDNFVNLRFTLVMNDFLSKCNDKIVKGIDGLYENTNAESKIKYVIDEAKFGSSQLGKTKDGRQMSNDWLKGSETGKSRILKAVEGDEVLAEQITKALKRGKVERVLSKVDSSGKVKTFKIDAKSNIVGEWP